MGCEDEEIFDYANSNNLGIISHDKRFGRLFIENDTPITIIVIQVISPHPENTNSLISQAMSKIDLDKLPRSSLVLINKNKIRIRKK